MPVPDVQVFKPTSPHEEAVLVHGLPLSVDPECSTVFSLSFLYS